MIKEHTDSVELKLNTLQKLSTFALAEWGDSKYLETDFELERDKAVAEIIYPIMEKFGKKLEPVLHCDVLGGWYNNFDKVLTTDFGWTEKELDWLIDLHTEWVEVLEKLPVKTGEETSF